MSLLWSRFGPKFFRSTISVCVGASVVEWIQSNDTDFNIPSWQQLQSGKINDAHLHRDDNNAGFLEEDYDKVISQYKPKLEDPTHREILNFMDQIIDGISGPSGLKDNVVVDIGVGTGVFIEPIRNAIGENGCYIGLDISPAFLHYTNQRSGGNKNVQLHLCKDTDLCLPEQLKNNVDVFFLCATYHHLSDVNPILDQMYEYLKCGGKVVIVEFKKHDHGHHHHHDGQSHALHHHKHHGHASANASEHRVDTEWIRNHIPFTESQAKEQIISKGFVFEKDVLRENWKDHFVHVYRKPSFY